MTGDTFEEKVEAMDLLGDKSVLVTGSTAGIGFAIASLVEEERRDLNVLTAKIASRSRLTNRIRKMRG